DRRRAGVGDGHARSDGGDDNTRRGPHSPRHASTTYRRGAMPVLAALGSALLYALASVLQQRAAGQAPAERSLRLRLLVGLFARPMWVIGILADGAGFVLQFVALDHGSLVLVQPLLVSGLLFALPFGAALTHRSLTPSEWLGSAATVAGLAVFLVVAAPGPGHDKASHLAWLITGICT